jgi:hypothetical protein
MRGSPGEVGSDAVLAALPDAPIPRSAATLTGTVLDGSGAPVAGTTVTAAGENSGVRRTVSVDRKGGYTFAGLPPDTYTVTVSARGIEPIAPEQVTLGAGATSRLPILVTRLPVFTSTVRVTANPVEIATQQVQLQEKQRVLGVIPNFYTTYEWNAAPMTPKLKFHLSFRSLADPITIASTAALAGVEQWHNTYPGYGQGTEGYAKRFGAAYADRVIARLTGDAVLPTLFHQDPRYFYRGSGSVPSRALYAVKETVMCRSDSGRQELDYSRILASLIAAGASNLYHSQEDRSAGITFRDALVINAANGVENLLREFLSRGLTSHIPPGANGKP